MYALIVGVLLLVAKVAALGSFADLSWWIVLAPFAIAALWWQLSDATGLTKRREIAKLERRKQQRRAQAMASLGLDAHRDARARKVREAAERRGEMTARRDDAKADLGG